MMTLIFFDWSPPNSCAYFWLCDDIGKCPMLKVAIERAIEKLPYYDLAGNLFNVDHGIHKHQFVGFVSNLVQCLDIVSSTQLCHILHGFRLQYCCNLLIDYKTSYSFQHAGSSYTVITIDAFLED
jgi:hypothetical protein